MTPYGGAYAAAQQFLEQYPGHAQVQEILDFSGRDYTYLEPEVSGSLMTLSQLGNEMASGSGMMGGMMGGGMPHEMGGMMSSGPAPDPGAEMRDLLAERAKNRMSASQRFQQGASKMMSGGGY